MEGVRLLLGRSKEVISLLLGRPEKIMSLFVGHLSGVVGLLIGRLRDGAPTLGRFEKKASPLVDRSKK